MDTTQLASLILHMLGEVKSVQAQQASTGWDWFSHCPFLVWLSISGIRGGSASGP